MARDLQRRRRTIETSKPTSITRLRVYSVPMQRRCFNQLRLMSNVVCHIFGNRPINSLSDTRPVLFFKTGSPIEPVSFVHDICRDALQAASRKQSRFIRRLTPITLIGKATEKGLGDVAKAVLGPHFHEAGAPLKKVSCPIPTNNLLFDLFSPWTNDCFG